MKQSLHFRQEENKLHYHINQEQSKEIELEELKEEQVVEIIEKELKETSPLQIIVEESQSSIEWERILAPYGLPYACSSHTPLSHSVKTNNNIAPVSRRKVTGALNMLIVRCFPDDLASLDYPNERNKIHSALKDLQEKGIVEYEFVNVTDLSDFMNQMKNKKPDIFHFIGHTVLNSDREYEIALTEGGFSRAKGVSHDKLSSILIDNNVQFAFLNACDSTKIAYNLAKEGLATIGMKKEIRDKSSALFSEALYSSLANGDTLDISINHARNVLYKDNKENGNWSYPSLYIANQDTLGFRIEPSLVPMSKVTIDCNSTKYANVFIDGKLIGETPLETEIRIDIPVEIRIEKEGYKSRVENFRPINRKESFIRDLDPILGSLVVETNPKIANISVKCQRIDNPKEYKEVSTDALGRATFTEIPVGKYEVYTSYEVKGIGINIEEKSQTEPLELQFPIEMHLSHGMATVGSLILKWLKKPTTIIISLLFLLLTIGGTLFLNQDNKEKSVPDGMVLVNGTKKYTFLGMDINTENTPQLKGESDSDYRERRKLSQLMIDEIRSAESATQVQRYWGDAPKIYTLKNDFYIDKTEVTVGQYAKFLRALNTDPSLLVQYQHPLDLDENKKPNKKYYKDFTPKNWKNQIECPNCPIVNIDYFMAWSYAKFVGKRIPTDIEWEIAARGKEGRVFPWGNQYEPWRYNGYASQYTKPTTVANLKYKKGWTSNGIADMAGNVDEWVVKKEGKYGIDVELKGGSVSSRGVLFILNYGNFIVDKPNNISKTTGFRCVSDNNSDKGNMVLIENGAYRIGGIHNYYFDLIRKLKAYNGQYKQRLVGERPLSIPNKNQTKLINNLKEGLKDFFIDAHEVTVGEYADFADNMKNDTGFRNHILRLLKLDTLPLEPLEWEKQIKDTSKPIGGVSWFMATAYCVSQDKRLPTIFEYEYLIGGANKYTYPNGENYFDREKAINNFKNGKNAMNLADIGQGKLFNAIDERFKKNIGTGIYHLIGNVSEWADDPRYMTGKNAYLKGGDFKLHGDIGANRFFKYSLDKQTYNNEEVGFRCAKDK